jgi:LacI family transcriptional regulator
MKKTTLGFVLPHYPHMFSTFYTMELIQGASKGALSLGVDLLIHIAHQAEGEKQDLDLKIFDSSFASGLLFADFMGNEGLVAKAKEKKIPYVILNYFDADSEDSCIGVDNEAAGKEVIDYLFGLGHKTIATITGKINAQAGSDRLEGYKKGLRAHGLAIDDDYIIKGDWTREGGKKGLEKIMKLNPRPSAVFVAGDEMAIGLIEEAKHKGIAIPGDLSVVGFDDIPLASSNLISLTTVRQPLYEVGRLGVKYLKSVVDKKTKEPVKVLLNNTQIVARSSVKSCRGKK